MSSFRKRVDGQLKDKEQADLLNDGYDKAEYDTWQESLTEGMKEGLEDCFLDDQLQKYEGLASLENVMKAMKDEDSMTNSMPNSVSESHSNSADESIDHQSELETNTEYTLDENDSASCLPDNDLLDKYCDLADLEEQCNKTVISGLIEGGGWKHHQKSYQTQGNSSNLLRNGSSAPMSPESDSSNKISTSSNFPESQSSATSSSSSRDLPFVSQMVFKYSSNGLPLVKKRAVSQPNLDECFKKRKISNPFVYKQRASGSQQVTSNISLHESQRISDPVIGMWYFC